MEKSFESYKADLWLRASLENLRDQKLSDAQRKTAKGIEKVGIKTIYDQAIYINDVLLPQIEKNRTRDHADYRFFRGVFVSLMWAVCLADRNEFIEVRHHRVSLQLEFYKEHSEKLERLFNKYATIEDLFLSSGLDNIAEGITQRVNDLLNKK